MAQTPESERRVWASRADAKGKDFMLIACDTFEYAQFPVFATSADYWDKYDSYNNPDRMSRVEGTYVIRNGEFRAAEFNELPTKPIKHKLTIVLTDDELNAAKGRTIGVDVESAFKATVSHDSYGNLVIVK